jgi:hypothetical protein
MRLFFRYGGALSCKVFSVGRTSFWIVYEVDEAERVVDILKVWNSKQDPDDFEF